MVVDGEEEEEFLSEHTLSMQRAVVVCEEMWSEIEKLDACFFSVGFNRERKIDIEGERAAGLELFLEELQVSGMVPVVCEDGMDAAQFRVSFQRGNIPCLIRGRMEFRGLSSKWCTDTGLVRRQWFLNNLSGSKLVPIRQQTNNGVVDDEGRADECATVMMPIKEWIDSPMDDPKDYLKDWHLQQEMELENAEGLYGVPDIFEHDILNDFLTTFTSGDYRFTYWGPPNSKTLLHSDVLNSFSWSHNVVGEKKWMIYPPRSSLPVVVKQRADETMFIPSGWQHEVENLVETLSVNHNWITAANVDRTWQCILTEWKAVETECREWNISDYAARESMLKGCVGLDVTSFFLMLLFSILKLATDDSRQVSEREIELHRLSGALASVFSEESIELKLRLQAVLCSDKLAIAAITIAQQVLKMTEEVGRKQESIT